MAPEDKIEELDQALANVKWDTTGLSEVRQRGEGFYFDQLYNHPVRTKAISCCVIATADNLVSQYVSGSKALSQNSIVAYAAFGLFFGGTLPHYFYSWLERIVDEDASFSVVKKLYLERLIYSPLYTAFMLYMIARLEGKDHNTALIQLEVLYWLILTASWKYLTIIQFLNLHFVPPMLRVLIVNLVGFFWTIYVANKRRQQQLKGKR